MSRYFSAAPPRADNTHGFDHDGPRDLYVPEHVPYYTGLLDSHGNDIWRAPNPIGFGRDAEW